MPQIAPFFIFMQEQRDILNKRCGYILKNAELQVECGKMWEIMSPAQKGKYQTKGKKNSETYDTRGTPMSFIENERKAAEKYQKDMEKYITSWLESLNDGEGIQKGVFYILSVLNYVELPQQTVPVEVGIVKVSFEHGIIDEFYYYFDSCIIAGPYSAEAKSISETTHYLPTSHAGQPSQIDYADFNAKMISFIQNEGSQSPVYVSWEDYKVIRRSLDKCDIDKLENIKIYSLQLLLHGMFVLSNQQAYGPIQDLLRNSEFDYENYTGCQWHQFKYIDGLNYCALGKCQRFFYIMCKNLNIEKTYNIKMLPYRHKPGKKQDASALAREADQHNTAQKPVQRELSSSWGTAEVAGGIEALNISSQEEYPPLSMSSEPRRPGGGGVQGPKKIAGLGRGRKNK